MTSVTDSFDNFKFRRRVQSENIKCLSNAEVKCLISEKSKPLKFNENGYINHRNDNILKKDQKHFILEEIDNTSMVHDYLQKGYDYGLMESHIVEQYFIGVKDAKLFFTGRSLQSTCCLHLQPKVVDYDRQFGYIQTSNKFHEDVYGSKIYSQSIHGLKEVLNSTGEINPFYSFKSYFEVNPGKMPPHNIELSMTHTPSSNTDLQRDGVDLKEAKENINISCYIHCNGII